MKKVITWDLETIADKSVVPLLPEVVPKKSLKDPIKIEADIKEKKAYQLAKLGLNPTTAMICCFGWHDSDTGKTNHIILKEETKKAEKKLVQQAWEVLVTGDHFVTFNGIGFDMPMLKMRSLINKVRPAINISTKKYTIQNHTDARMILSNWDNFAKGNLDFYCRLLLGETPKENLSGDQVQDAWDMELYDEIGKYCEADCSYTYKIYDLLVQYYI